MHKILPRASLRRTAVCRDIQTRHPSAQQTRPLARSSSYSSMGLSLQDKVLDPIRIVLLDTGLALPGVSQPHVGRLLRGVVLDVGGEFACFGLEPVGLVRVSEGVKGCKVVEGRGWTSGVLRSCRAGGRERCSGRVRCLCAVREQLRYGLEILPVRIRALHITLDALDSSSPSKTTATRDVGDSLSRLPLIPARSLHLISPRKTPVLDSQRTA